LKTISVFREVVLFSNYTKEFSDSGTSTTISRGLKYTLPVRSNWIRISGEIWVGFKEGLDISMSRFSGQTFCPLSKNLKFLLHLTFDLLLDFWTGFFVNLFKDGTTFGLNFVLKTISVSREVVLLIESTEEFSDSGTSTAIRGGLNNAIPERSNWVGSSSEVGISI